MPKLLLINSCSECKHLESDRMTYCTHPKVTFPAIIDTVPIPTWCPLMTLNTESAPPPEGEQETEFVEAPNWQRPAVLQFANTMERKLREHDDRPGWESEPLDYLWDRLLEELFEVKQAMAKKDGDAVHDECADAANFLMMIADNALREFEIR